MKQNIIDSLEKNYMPYTAHVIMQRALPEIDGFKPSQRRILYTMYKMNLLRSEKKKSQSIVGQTMFIHAHGDTAIYDTAVRMSKDNEALLHPYIKSKGNFGKVFSRDMQQAAARYTNMKLMDMSAELFRDIDKNTVDMVDSYDGTQKEPRLLPVSFPNILTNSQSGMAVGMSSNIPSFNLREVVDYTIAYLKDQDAVVSDYVLAPDFPTEGKIVYNKDQFKKIFDTGRGTFRIRADYEVDGNTILFNNVPYTTTFEAVIDRITDLIREGRITEITDINDIFGLDSKGVEITVKNNTDIDLLIEKLYQMTQLEDTFGCNFNLVVNGEPKVLSFKDIIHEWTLFRADAIKRGAKFDKDRKETQRHLLTALEKVLTDIETAITIIRETEKSSDVVDNLMNEFSIDKEQAEYVSNIRLRQLNEEYLVERIDEIKSLDEELEQLNNIIDNKVALAKLMIKQLEEVRDKFGEDRKTGIINVEDIPKIDVEEETIEDFNVRVFVTKEGYLKKIPLTSLRGNFEIRVRDGDVITDTIETTNDSDILVFTDHGNVYKHKLHEIDNHRPSVLGEFMPALLELEDENILYMTVTNDYKGDLLVGFDDGRVARINLTAYETKQNRSMLRSAYADKNAVFFGELAEGEEKEILAISSTGRALILDTSNIGSRSGRTVGGVIVMRSRDDSTVERYALLDEDKDESEYYRLANAGVGKYLKEGDFSDLPEE